MVNTYGLGRIKFIVDLWLRCETRTQPFTSGGLLSDIKSELFESINYLSPEEKHLVESRIDILFHNFHLSADEEINEDELAARFINLSSDKTVIAAIKQATIRWLAATVNDNSLNYSTLDWTTIDLGLGIKFTYKLGAPSTSDMDLDEVGIYLQDYALVAKDKNILHGFASSDHVDWFNLHTDYPTTILRSDFTGHGGNILCSKGLMFIGKNTIQKTPDLKNEIGSNFPELQIIEVGQTNLDINLENYPDRPDLVCQPSYHLDLFMAILDHDTVTKKIKLLFAEPRMQHYAAVPNEAKEVVCNLRVRLIETQNNLIASLQAIEYSVEIYKCPMGVYIRKIGDQHLIVDHYPLINGIFETHNYGRSLVTAAPITPRAEAGDLDSMTFKSEFISDLNQIGYTVSVLGMNNIKLAGLHCLTLVIDRV